MDDDFGNEDSVIISQKIPNWGFASQVTLSHPLLNQINSSLEGSLEQLRNFWNDRDDIYSQTKELSNAYKLRESALLEGGKKVMQISEALVQNIMSIGNQIEALMVQSLKFGNKMIQFIVDNLQTVFIEQNLQEKVNGCF